MLEKMDFMLIGAKNRMGKYLERIEKEEDGSVMIEIIILIVVIIAVAAVFKDQLSGAIQAAFGRLTSYVSQ